MNTIEILSKLMSFDTTSEKSNLQMMDFIQDFLGDLGFKTTRIFNPTGEKSGIYAEIGPAGDGILLSAHSDTVPADPKNWNHPPFALTQVEDRLYGRGTTDMKGFLAAMLSSAKAASSRSLKAPLKLVISYDEEIGCVGIADMIPKLRSMVGAPALCIVGEPTGMDIGIGHKGKVAYLARFSGNKGHSALAPKFVNALHLANDFALELRRLQERLVEVGAKDEDYSIPYSTIHIGAMHGGGALNIVPDQAEMKFELRYLPEDDISAILSEIEGVADQIAKKYQSTFSGAKIQLERITAYPGFNLRADDAIVADFKRDSGMDQTTKLSFGTEAGFFSEELGIPTIVCGPGSMQGQGHKDDEYLEIDQLQRCEALLDSLLSQALY